VEADVLKEHSVVAVQVRLKSSCAYCPHGSKDKLGAGSSTLRRRYAGTESCFQLLPLKTTIALLLQAPEQAPEKTGAAKEARGASTEVDKTRIGKGRWEIT